jgi:hypothetical protein
VFKRPSGTDQEALLERSGLWSILTSASRSLPGILIAVIGGLIGQWFHATRDRSQMA